MTAAKSIILVISAMVSTSLLAQPSIKQLARIESSTIENNTNDGGVSVKVMLRNLSDRAISAYTVAALGTYPDGTQVEQEVTADLVWVVANERLGWPIPANSAFRPGETATLSVSLPRSKAGAAPITASATLRMIAFADRTAVGSADDIERLMVSRRNEADLVGGLVADMESLIGKEDPRKGLDELVASRQKAAAAGSPKAHEVEVRLQLLRTIVAPVGGDKGKLKSALDAYTTRRAVLLEHATLNRGTEK